MTGEIEMEFAAGGRLRLDREDEPPHRLRLSSPGQVIIMTDEEAKMLANELWRHSITRAAATIGSIGGVARAMALTPEQRSEIAKNAARARWAKPQSEQTYDPGAYDPGVVAAIKRAKRLARRGS